MSQRFLAPTNLFYYWRDPLPPDFPAPNTGDVYLNVTSWMLRVYYEGAWHDAGSGTIHGALSGLDQDDHPQYLTTERADDQYIKTTDIVVSSLPPPAGGPPLGAPNTLWVQY